MTAGPKQGLKDREPKSPKDPFHDLIPFGELKKKIPRHLLQRSLFWGLYYTATSLLFSAIAQYAYWLAVNSPLWEQHWALVVVMDLVAIWMVGTVHTGLWSLAHECGHGGLTPYTLLNNLIGFTIHTGLMVPYFPWQQSHAQHHARNQHVSQGETHRPRKTKEWTERPKKNWGFRYWFKRNVTHPMGLTLGLLIGWRIYLMFGETGAIERPDGRKVQRHSHHCPVRLFPDSYPSWKVVISNVALLAPLYGWYLFHEHFGTIMFLRMIIGPQFVVDLWLNAITKAQHSHPKTKYLAADAWDWYKGALQTVDHSYGALVDRLHHHIGPTHVSHHIWPAAPAHNGVAITKILKKELGRHYVVPKKGPWTTIFANSYRRVNDKPDEFGFHDWVGLHDRESF